MTRVDAQQWLYQLIRESRPITNRTFEITSSAPRAYVFTFG